METNTREITTKQADAFTAYVIEFGEADPKAPTNSSIEEAIRNFDGSCESEDQIWAEYRYA